jgi:hypothetical protein
MSEQEQRIAIAEVLGWKGPKHPGTLDRIKTWPFSHDKELWVIDPSGAIVSVHSIPDYPHDLNACHEMEKTLKPSMRFRYVRLIERIAAQANGFEVCKQQMDDAVVFTTAPQRCEAFLRTFNLWKD